MVVPATMHAAPEAIELVEPAESVVVAEPAAAAGVGVDTPTVLHTQVADSSDTDSAHTAEAAGVVALGPVVGAGLEVEVGSEDSAEQQRDRVSVLERYRAHLPFANKQVVERVAAAVVEHLAVVVVEAGAGAGVECQREVASVGVEVVTVPLVAATVESGGGAEVVD